MRGYVPRPDLATWIHRVSHVPDFGETCNAFGPAIPALFDGRAHRRAGPPHVRFRYGDVRFRTGPGASAAAGGSDRPRDPPDRNAAPGGDAPDDGRCRADGAREQPG